MGEPIKLGKPFQFHGRNIEAHYKLRNPLSGEHGLELLDNSQLKKLQSLTT